MHMLDATITLGCYTYHLFSVSYRGWLIETSSESLSDQRSRGRVVAAGSSVYVL